MSDHSTTADRPTPVDQPTTASQSTASDHSTTASQSATVERSTSCPLCTFSGETRNDVYTHLLTGHRKSSISELLLEWHSTDATR